MGDNKKDTYPLFKGIVNDIWQFKNYMDLMAVYNFHVEGQKPRFTLRLHPRNKDEGITLVFEKKYMKKRGDEIILRYASGKDINPKDVRGWKDRLAKNRINVSCRMDDILESEDVVVEGYPGAPRLDPLIPLGKFEYMKVLMNACRMSDEKRKDTNGKEKQKQEIKIIKPNQLEEDEQGPAPERKFEGTARSLVEAMAYFDLLEKGYPNYSDFALVFSCPDKLPLYLGLELGKGVSKGPYHITCAYYPAKVKISPENAAQADQYVLNRLNARMSAGEIKIQGFAYPAVVGTGVVFPEARQINQFKLDLSTTLGRMFDQSIVSNVVPNGDDEEIIADEDHDTRKQPAVKAEVDLPTGFEDEAKDRLDDLFGKDE